MKGPRFTTGLLIVTGIICARVSGADEPASALARVRVEVQMVGVSVADARSLVPALQNAKTAQETFARVQQMLAQSHATLIGWPITWLRCGLAGETPRGVSESVEEFRYPTESDPPTPPQTFSMLSEPSAYRWPLAPTSFNTRNTQATLEATATVDAGGRTLTLSLTPQFVRFLRFHEFRFQRSPEWIEGIIVQPNFWTMRTTADVRVIHDQPTLIASFVVPEPEPHVELFILRARATLLPAAANIAPPVPPEQ